jgi:N-methylhydantoinase A
VRTYRGRLEAWETKPAENRLRELQEQCVTPLTAEGIARERIDVRWSADLRYSGQNYEIEIPWRDTPEALRADFEARHRRLYGYATGESVECVNLRSSRACPTSRRRYRRSSRVARRRARRTARALPGRRRRRAAAL